MIRCDECENCLALEKVKESVLKVANPPFSHADQDVVDLWNTELQRLPCLEKGIGILIHGIAGESIHKAVKRAVEKKAAHQNTTVALYFNGTYAVVESEENESDVMKRWEEDRLRFQRGKL